MPKRGAGNPAEEVRRLSLARRRAPLDMGRALAELAGADRTAAAQEAGLSRRTGYYLARIAQAVDAGLLTRDDAVRLGWGRARVLAERALKTNREVSAKQIEHALAAPARTLASQDGAPSRVFMDFSLSAGQAKIVRSTLVQFGAPVGAGGHRRAKALAEICRAAVSTLHGVAPLP